MSDIETGNSDPGYPHDWRGNDIGVYSRVIYHGRSRHSSFKIGTVLGFTPAGMLRVKWSESEWKREVDQETRVWPEQVMVFREGPN